MPGLSLENINKTFGRITALDSASLAIRPGTIHALLGENGAGKTTLMRIAFGMIRPDSGTVRVNGQAVLFASPFDAIAAGIGMVHQQFSLIPEMTVAENVALGGRGRYNNRLVADRVTALAAKMGMTLDPLAKVKELTASERQKLEIIRTFAHKARILILDEPTAVLTPQDVGDLFAQLRAFADNGGSVVLITHKLHDALKHANEVTVLRRGHGVLNALITEVDDEMLAAAMLGHAQISRPRIASCSVTAPRVALELKNVTLRNERGIVQLSNVSLVVREGEIVGVAALEGAAKSMMRLMAGRITPNAGEMKRPSSIGFVPEDRVDEAIIPDFSLSENMALRSAAARSGRIDWTETGQRVESIISQYDVRAPGADIRIRNLSGGNQQKFVLGRELSGAPALLVLENPTQGLDVHATAAIHEKIRSARNAGTAVVMYSSDLEELAALSDRVIVVSEGSITEMRPDLDLIGRSLLSTTAS